VILTLYPIRPARTAPHIKRNPGIAAEGFNTGAVIRQSGQDVLLEAQYRHRAVEIPHGVESTRSRAGGELIDHASGVGGVQAEIDQIQTDFQERMEDERAAPETDETMAQMNA
jgi:hypothetical protein